MVTLIYPMLAVIVGWVLGGPGAIVAKPFLPPDPPLLAKLAALAIIVVSFAVCAVLMFNSERIAACAVGLFCETQVRASTKKWIEAIILTISFFVVFVGIDISALPLVLHNKYYYFIGGAVPHRSAVSILYFVVLASFNKTSIALKSALLIFALLVILNAIVEHQTSKSLNLKEARDYIAGAAVIASAVCFSLFASSSGIAAIGVAYCALFYFPFDQDSFVLGSDADLPLNFLVFWCLLPAANALMDYGSWAISRKLVHGLIRGGGKLSALWHVALDALLAAGFLVLLAGLLPMIIQAVNRVIATPRFTHGLISIPLAKADPAIVWAPFLENAIEHPFTAGFAVTAMLATTLIPTALHLAAAVIAVAISPMPGHAWVVGKLRHAPPLAAIDQVRVVCWFEAWTLLSFAVVVAVCAALWWLVTSALDASLGLTLVNVACWSARLVSTPALPIPAVCLPGN